MDEIIPTRTVAEFKVKLAIYERLKELLEPHPDLGEGFFRYRENATDTTVAREMDVPVSTVSYIRNDMFGPIRRLPGTAHEPRPAAPVRDTRVDALQAEIAEAKREIAALRSDVVALRNLIHERLRRLTVNKDGQVTFAGLPTWPQ